MTALLRPSLPLGAMPLGSCDGPAQARWAYSGKVNSVVRSGPSRACVRTHGAAFVVMWVVGPCASFTPPCLGARESAETRTRAARRGGGAPRRCASRAAHARSARKTHASGRTRGCCLGGMAGCRARSGGGARARRHGGVCRGMGPRAARAGRGLVCPLRVSGFRSCRTRPPSGSFLGPGLLHPFSPDIAQDNGRTRRSRPAPERVPIFRPSAADRFPRETRQSTTQRVHPTGIQLPNGDPLTKCGPPRRSGDARGAANAPRPWSPPPLARHLGRRSGVGSSFFPRRPFRAFSPMPMLLRASSSPQQRGVAV